MSTPSLSSPMQALLHVLAINDIRTGTNERGPWQSQDVEAATLNDSGGFVKVGRLRLPKDLVGKVSPGVYMAAFSLDRDETKEGGGRLVARLVGLLPYALKGQAAGVVASAAAAK